MFLKNIKLKNFLLKLLKKVQFQTSIYIPVKKISIDDVFSQSEIKLFYKFKSSKADQNESEKFSPCLLSILDLL